MESNSFSPSALRYSRVDRRSTTLRMFSCSNLITSSALKRSGLEDRNRFNGRPRLRPWFSHKSVGIPVGTRRRKFGTDLKWCVCGIFRRIVLSLYIQHKDIHAHLKTGCHNFEISHPRSLKVERKIRIL